MKATNLSALKIVLVIFGAFAIFTGIDFEFGGFKTLGWQGSTDFIQIGDQTRYGGQDSNFRFFGGVLAAIGGFIIFAVTNRQKDQQTLKVIFALIVVGGLMRFTSGDFAVLFGADIRVALLVELGVMPLLYFWLGRALKTAG